MWRINRLQGKISLKKQVIFARYAMSLTRPPLPRFKPQQRLFATDHHVDDFASMLEHSSKL